MKMFKTNAYCVAYSDDGKDIKTSKFKLIKNNFGTFTADPFLFAKDGRLYIFAEIYSYVKRKGMIGYSIYEKGSFGKWRIIIEEEYHLSYPYIYEENGTVYIMPESAGAYEVYRYKCMDFPDVWEKDKVFMRGVRFVDSSLFRLQNKEMAFSYCVRDIRGYKKERLYLFDAGEEFDDAKMLEVNPPYARCGGRVFSDNNKNIRVAQDCSQIYGGGLVFNSFKLEDGKYTENVEMTVHPPGN